MIYNIECFWNENYYTHKSRIFPGNAFIVSVALADLLISSILIPTSVIIILAGFNETSKEICRVQWFFAACAFLVTILSLAVSNPNEKEKKNI